MVSRPPSARIALHAAIVLLTFAGNEATLRAQARATDERVTFELGAVEGKPGGTIAVPLSVVIEPGGPLVREIAAVVRYDPSVLQFAWIERRYLDYRVDLWLPPILEDGTLVLRLSYESRSTPREQWTPQEWLSPENSGVVFDLDFCVLTDAPAGAHPVRLLAETGSRENPGSPVYATFFYDGERLDSLQPAMDSGTVTVTNDLGGDGECPPIVENRITREMATDAILLELGDVTVRPGATDVGIPLYAHLDEGMAVHVVSPVISYDTDVVVPRGEHHGFFEFRAASDVGFIQLFQPSWFREGGTVAATLAFAGAANQPFDVVDESRLLTWQNDGLLGTLRLCVPTTAEPGTYPLQLEIMAASSGTAEAHTTCRLYPSLEVVSPLRGHGSITVEGEPDLSSDCPAPPPVEPVTFTLGDANVAPGEIGVTIPLSIDVEPGAFPVIGWTVVLRYDPMTFGGVSLDSTRAADIVSFHPQEEFTEPGKVSLSVIHDVGAGRGEVIDASNDGLVAMLTLCVLEGAVPGAHAMDIVDGARRVDSVEVLTRYTANSGSQIPRLEGGTVTVTGDAVSPSACVMDVRPGTIEGKFELESSFARPGDNIRMPFTIRVKGDVGADGFQFSVDFDEEALQVTSIERVFELPDGTTDYGFASLEFNNQNDSPGNGGLDEGFLFGGVLFSFDRPGPPVLLPPTEDVEVLTFHFHVSPEAELGSETLVRFVDGARDGRILNVLTVDGKSVLPDRVASYIYIDALVQIVGDVSVFIRGDANGDEVVDISDAMSTLGFLFFGDQRPVCFDAADANDDGLIDVSDAIFSLGFLFLGEEFIPEPHPAAGEDPTADGLGCRFRDS